MNTFTKVLGSVAALALMTTATMAASDLTGQRNDRPTFSFSVLSNGETVDLIDRTLPGSYFYDVAEIGGIEYAVYGRIIDGRDVGPSYAVPASTK